MFPLIDVINLCAYRLNYFFLTKVQIPPIAPTKNTIGQMNKARMKKKASSPASPQNPSPNHKMNSP